MKISQLQTKKFYNIGPWTQCYKTFLSVIYKCYQQAEVFVPDKLSQFYLQTLQLSTKVSKIQLCIFFNFDLRTQCYKTFYICHLQMFLISQGVCPQQAFPAQSIICEQGQELIQLWSPWQDFLQAVKRLSTTNTLAYSSTVEIKFNWSSVSCFGWHGSL